MIRAVAFDVGNVILEIDVDTCIERLGIKDNWSQFSQWKGHWDFETGKLTTTEFFELCKISFSLNLNPIEFESLWNSIISNFVTGMPELIQSLSEKLTVVAITNTNDPHLKLFQSMPEFRPFHQIYASHQLGVRKPNPQIFKMVLESLSIASEELIFFDDLDENVASASRLGINAYSCYRSSERVRSVLGLHSINI